MATTLNERFDDTPRFDNSGGRNELLCPQCGFNYMHHDLVETFEPEADDYNQNGLHTIIEGIYSSNTTVTTKYDNLPGNPSYRRNGLRIRFTCEDGHVSFLRISQHKGNTHVEWEME